MVYITIVNYIFIEWSFLLKNFLFHIVIYNNIVTLFHIGIKFKAMLSYALYILDHVRQIKFYFTLFIKLSSIKIKLTFLIVIVIEILHTELFFVICFTLKIFTYTLYTKGCVYHI